MTTLPVVVRALLSVVVTSAAACRRADSPSHSTRGPSRVDSPLQVTRAPPGAEAVLNEYLRRGTVMMSSTPVPESLFAPESMSGCERYGSGPDLQLALARFHVTGSEMQGDTAVVHADVVSVAQVQIAVDGPYDVTQQVSKHSLSWSLLRDSTSNRWGICGWSREGPDFLRIQFLGATARWLGGASLAGEERLADSVARAP